MTEITEIRIPDREPPKDGRIVICVSEELETRFAKAKEGRRNQVYDALRTFVRKLCDTIESAETETKD